jgi:Lar family restriction alleviation protein
MALDHQTMDKPTLEPCPFCGSNMDSFAGMTPDAFAKSQDGFTKSQNGFAVNCDCGAIGPTGATMEQAIAEWNTRADA